MSYPRPLSPHLQIYRPQLTSVLSITHRATGMVLSIGALALVYWLVSLASGEACYTQAYFHFASWYGQLALFGWSICFYYHLCNGIRHLFWDVGYGFELPTVYKSGWAVLTMTVFLTAVTWVAALQMGD